MSKVNVLIDALEERGCSPREMGGKWRAQCPSHGSKGGTLAVSEENGRVLFHCFAGCDGSDVLGSLGLQFKDLRDEGKVWVPRPRKPKKEPTFVDPVGLAERFGCELRPSSNGVWVGVCPCGGWASAGPGGATCSNGCPVESVGGFFRDLDDARLLRERNGMKKLEVVMCTEHKTGVSQKTGQSWTQYKVQANDEMGSPISEELLSWTFIPNGMAEFEVKREDHEKYGTKFWVRDPRAKSLPAPNPVVELRQEINVLKDRLDALESRLGSAPAVAPVVSNVNDPVPF